MLSVFSFRGTGIAMIVLLGAFVVFHVLVLARVVPHGIVWGGRIDDRGRLMRMEAVSIAMLLASGVLVVWHLQTGGAGGPGLFSSVGMWVLVALFALNTVGNIVARTPLERFAFTPVTLLLAVMAMRLALERTLAGG